MAEEKILRLGEWLDTRWGQYTQYMDVYTPGSNGMPLVTLVGNGISLNVERRNINFIDGYSLARMIKDYDKYLDDRLVL